MVLDFQAQRVLSTVASYVGYICTPIMLVSLITIIQIVIFQKTHTLFIGSMLLGVFILSMFLQRKPSFQNFMKLNHVTLERLWKNNLSTKEKALLFFNDYRKGAVRFIEDIFFLFNFILLSFSYIAGLGASTVIYFVQRRMSKKETVREENLWKSHRADEVESKDSHKQQF
jgi:hypothetical protein